MARKHAKEKRPAGGFVALPHVVIDSAQFASLSAHAVKLLVDLMVQYDGGNNGDLDVTWRRMQARGWRSRDTLWKALRELIDGGWIAQTRQGGMHAPSLYGITIYALDPDPKLDVSARSFPRGLWSQRPPQKRIVQHAGRVNSPRIDTPAVSIASPNRVN